MHSKAYEVFILLTPRREIKGGREKPNFFGRMEEGKSLGSAIYIEGSGAMQQKRVSGLKRVCAKKGEGEI